MKLEKYIETLKDECIGTMKTCYHDKTMCLFTYLFRLEEDKKINISRLEKVITDYSINLNKSCCEDWGRITYPIDHLINECSDPVYIRECVSKYHLNTFPRIQGTYPSQYTKPELYNKRAHEI